MISSSKVIEVVEVNTDSYLYNSKTTLKSSTLASKRNCTNGGQEEFPFTIGTAETTPRRNENTPPGFIFRNLTVSCTTIHYAAHMRSFQTNSSMIIGILSNAKKRSRRETVRLTWKKEFKRAFFLVSGPFDKIRGEFFKFKDLIWIDAEEHYRSLTFKSLSFLQIAHELSNEQHAPYRYLFKTDDDSYPERRRLESALIHAPLHSNLQEQQQEKQQEQIDYWGNCWQHQQPVIRE